MAIPSHYKRPGARTHSVAVRTRTDRRLFVNAGRPLCFSEPPSNIGAKRFSARVALASPATAIFFVSQYSFVPCGYRRFRFQGGRPGQTDHLLDIADRFAAGDRSARRYARRRRRPGDDVRSAAFLAIISAKLVGMDGHRAIDGLGVAGRKGQIVPPPLIRYRRNFDGLTVGGQVGAAEPAAKQTQTKANALARRERHVFSPVEAPVLCAKDDTPAVFQG